MVDRGVVCVVLMTLAGSGGRWSQPGHVIISRVCRHRPTGGPNSCMKERDLDVVRREGIVECDL